jgi:hypothetical protein
MDPRYLGENTGEGILLHGVKQRTYYITSEQEQESYRLRFKDGILIDHSGKPLTTDPSIKFVMDEFGNIFGGNIKTPGFHEQHSAFLAGKPVTFAGRITVINGEISAIDNISGHYKTPMDSYKYLLDEVKRSGVDISKIKVNEHWLIKHPSLKNVPHLYGPQKTGAELMAKFSATSPEERLKHLLPRNFWDVAAEWIGVEFPHRNQLLKIISTESNWPETFWKKVPSLLQGTAGEINKTLFETAQRHIKEGRITKDKLRSLGIDLSSNPRDELVLKIKEKLFTNSSCE